MHKKLEADLMSLAHSILQMKNRDDVFALEAKAKVISSKLSMLAFVETYVNTTPNLKETKEELIASVEKAFEIKEVPNVIQDEIAIVQELEVSNEKLITPIVAKEEVVEEEVVEEEKEEEFIEEALPSAVDVADDLFIEATENVILEQPFDALEATLFPSEVSEETPEEAGEDSEEIKIHTLEEELKDTIPVDVMANLFEMAQPVSLNDTLTKNIQIGLNDRIAFVKNLFDGSQEDFNRVLSQLNSFKTEKEAIKFINKMVKPDYNWDEQEEFETRFMEIIQRKFV
ncbi:hypothetical protein OAB30_01615 [Polaribacter sp.]|jgi:hypothetical protein|nr:hypothetical protein [bacterium]MDA9348627.1 hypothetical protein [Polaribacter sp.]MDB0025752.1 hypothetical protein [Polaribacter sp.]MDB9777496.1 hypothetical protein [Polaribacter sp.]MDB9888056.1 hypothetical protein [Polaribacter sp.]